MILVYFCQNNSHVINFTTDDRRSKFEPFSKNKINELYQTKIMQTEWLQTLYEYWDRGDTPNSGDFDFYSKWLFQYYD